jgi:uncharacterized protein
MKHESRFAYPSLASVAASFALLVGVQLVAFGWASRAWASFEVPKLTGPVVDRAQMIDRASVEQIDRALRALRSKGGTQITVLTVPNLGGLSIEEASIRVVDQWKLGGANQDNGVLLMVARAERSIRIEVGQGLEGTLTDAASRRIIDDSITPLFRSGQFGSGLLVGVQQIAKTTNPEMDMSGIFGSQNWKNQRSGGRVPDETGWLQILFVICFFLLMFSNKFSHGGRRSTGLGRGWGGSGMGHGGSGGGSWRGGGGGFSGGGASGRW